MKILEGLWEFHISAIDATTTNKKELDYIHLKRTQLCAEYMSDVALDRKILYQQAKNAIKNQVGSKNCLGSGEITLVDYLEDAEGKIRNLAEKKFALAVICMVALGVTIYTKNVKITEYGERLSETWEYNEYQFAIIGEIEEEGDSGPIAKVALSIIYDLN